jgi:hypothetical protein
MLERYEITHLDGTVEYAEGDDVRVHNGALHIWNQRYNTGASYLAATHAGSWPLTSIRRWRKIER